MAPNTGKSDKDTIIPEAATPPKIGFKPWLWTGREETRENFHKFRYLSDNILSDIIQISLTKIEILHIRGSSRQIFNQNFCQNFCVKFYPQKRDIAILAAFATKNA